MIDQELLSTDRTDLIDEFGVIQINLSNRGFRNQDLCYIFHKDARFIYGQNCRILSDSLLRASKLSQQKIRDVECYVSFKDPKSQREILLSFCEEYRINLLLHTAQGDCEILFFLCKIFTQNLNFIFK